MQKQTPKRPTLKTIADLTGLSLSMVSLCLRDGKGVKKSTRDKVLAAAKDVGYVPNRAGVRLRTGRTNVLALVLAAEENAVDYTRLLIQGIGSQIHDTRYHLNVVPEFEKSDPLSALRYVLEAKSADGVIITHTKARDPRIEMLMDQSFPFVSHGRTEFSRPHAFHDFHVEHYLGMAVKRLASKGRQRILLATVNKGTKNFSIITGSFKQAVMSENLTGEIVKNIEDLGTPALAREFGERLASSPHSFDGIICNNELTALAIIGGLHNKGLLLGQDYDLICRQTTELVPTLHPKMDTIGENLFKTGSELARLLIASIEGQDIGSLQTLSAPIPNWRSD